MNPPGRIKERWLLQSVFHTEYNTNVEKSQMSLVHGDNIYIRFTVCRAFVSSTFTRRKIIDFFLFILLLLHLWSWTGPAVADAIFMNKEEVDLKTIYYDPVHDFGFLRFDPKAVKFLEVEEIELNPDGAKVGVEIRVVGNDSGEKLR